MVYLKGGVMRPYVPVVLLVVLVAMSLFFFQCSNNPADVLSETLERFSLNAPDTVTTGEPFTITVTAVGSEGTAPFTEFSGIAILTASAGSCAPESLQITGGTGSGDIVLSGTTDAQIITATSGAINGSITLNAAFMTALLGDPGDPANEAIPTIDFVANADNYSAHPDLGTMPVSYNTIMLSFAIGTTVAQANILISNINGKIVGGITGDEAVAPGVLFLQLTTTSHTELTTIIETLRADPIIETVVQDALMGVNAIPRPNDGKPADWTWESLPAGSNWGLEQMRVPQLWNWNEAARKQLDSLGFYPPGVLILDDGFENSHPDLPVRLHYPNRVANHGTFIAGIIGARFNNGIGVDGVCPAVNMMCRTVTVTVQGLPDPYQDRISVGQAIITGAYQAMRAYSRVVNMSMGYNWADALVDSDADTLVWRICREQAQLFVNTFHLGTLRYRMPIFIVSSGNDSGRGYGTQHTRYNSPMCYAALEMGVETIIVVEAAQLSPTGAVEWWPFSSIGGHVSAPGDNVASTVSGAAIYGSSIYGSSVATAYVSGLAAYLYYMQPYLNWWEVRDLILSNAVQVGGNAAPFVDAWASAADIGRLRAYEPALRMMCDIDDGSFDGNQRVVYKDRVDLHDEDVDGDGGPGDGAIDMSDFRRWRDWYLASRTTDPVELNGAADHPKKDVNFDGIVGTPAEEQIYPRGDFNGDGMLDPTALSYVPGAIDAVASDIDVLRAIFDDPDYEEWELPNLIESGDVEIHITQFIPSYGATEATVRLDRGGTTLARTKVISINDPHAVITVPTVPEGYTITLDISGTNGSATYEFSGETFPFNPGDDLWLAPIPFIPIDPRCSYQHICSTDQALNAVPIHLASHGLYPGQYILIERVGYFEAGGGYSRADEMSAIFSRDNRILSSSLLHRIPGAIDAGNDFFTEETWECGGEPTDIPEDFGCSPHVAIKIPQGAQYIFITAPDVKYIDNSDNGGNYGAQITRFMMKNH